MDLENKSLRIQAFWLSLALAVQLFILVPGNLYFGNVEEFVTPMAALGRAYSIPAALLILLVIDLGLIIPSRKTHLYVAHRGNPDDLGASKFTGMGSWSS
jgi:hypothetical protein